MIFDKTTQFGIGTYIIHNSVETIQNACTCYSHTHNITYYVLYEVFRFLYRARMRRCIIEGEYLSYIRPLYSRIMSLGHVQVYIFSHTFLNFRRVVMMLERALAIFIIVIRGRVCAIPYIYIILYHVRV